MQSEALSKDSTEMVNRWSKGINKAISQKDDYRAKC